jgi:hypothetical protein
MIFSQTDLLTAHQHSSPHANEIAASRLCSYSRCEANFPPSALDEWAEAGDTALRPRGGIDPVLGTASDFPVLDPAYLRAMHGTWFGHGR